MKVFSQNSASVSFELSNELTLSIHETISQHFSFLFYSYLIQFTIGIKRCPLPFLELPSYKLNDFCQLKIEQK